MPTRCIPTPHWCVACWPASSLNGPACQSIRWTPTAPIMTSIDSATSWPLDCRASGGPQGRRRRRRYGCRSWRRTYHSHFRCSWRWGIRPRAIHSTGRCTDGCPDMTPTARSGDLQQAATDLAGFIRALRRIDRTGAHPRAPHSRGGPLAEGDEQVRRSIARLGDRIDGGAALHSWEQSLGACPWDGDEVWVHGDLLPGNLLVVDGRLSAEAMGVSIAGVERGTSAAPRSGATAEPTIGPGHRLRGAQRGRSGVRPAGRVERLHRRQSRAVPSGTRC